MPTAHRAKRLRIFAVGFALWAMGAGLPAASDFPIYLSAEPNPHDYTLFANSGWDGNWFLGYDNCWIAKLPPVPKGKYRRAFLGARLGRMKTSGPVGRPPEFPPVPGDVFMAISSARSWDSSQGVRIAAAEDIPLQGHHEFAIEGTGEAEWFWGEIDVEKIRPGQEHYAVIWSTSPAWVSVSSSPIIAAAWGGKDVDTWLCQNNAGEPPSTKSEIAQTGISYFKPAMALKLIPEGPKRPIEVTLISWKDGTKENPKPVVAASVGGESIEKVWIEAERSSAGGGRNAPALMVVAWQKLGRSLRKAPYIFTLNPKDLPLGRVRLRVVAQNIWGDTGSSDSFQIEVGRPK